MLPNLVVAQKIERQQMCVMTNRLLNFCFLSLLENNLKIIICFTHFIYGVFRGIRSSTVFQCVHISAAKVKEGKARRHLIDYECIKGIVIVTRVRIRKTNFISFHFWCKSACVSICLGVGVWVRMCVYVCACGCVCVRERLSKNEWVDLWRERRK